MYYLSEIPIFFITYERKSKLQITRFSWKIISFITEKSLYFSHKLQKKSPENTKITTTIYM